MKATDMADNIHKLEETQNDIHVAHGCDGQNSRVEKNMKDVHNVDHSDDNCQKTVHEKIKEEVVDDGKVKQQKTSVNTNDDHTDADAKTGHRKGLPICVICHSKCANKGDLAKHIEKYHK